MEREACWECGGFGQVKKKRGKPIVCDWCGGSGLEDEWPNVAQNMIHAEKMIASMERYIRMARIYKEVEK